MRTKICRWCGCTNWNDAKYCIRCGNKFSWSFNLSGSWGVFAFLGAAAVFLVLVFYGMYWLHLKGYYAGIGRDVKTVAVALKDKFAVAKAVSKNRPRKLKRKRRRKLR
jgi:hypothetical protein